MYDENYLKEEFANDVKIANAFKAFRNNLSLLLTRREKL